MVSFSSSATSRSTTSHRFKVRPSSVRLSRLLNRWKNFSRTFSDFEIICGDKSWPIHKNILALKSDVIANLFLSEHWKESKKNRLHISDFEPETVEMMLHFVYTNTLPDPVKCNADLLLIANKYNIRGLISFCGVELAKRISPSNAIDILDTAWKVNAEQLKNAAVSYISKIVGTVIDTPKWNKVIAPNSEIVMAIMRGKF